jgi:hypothetical protein
VASLERQLAQHDPAGRFGVGVRIIAPPQLRRIDREPARRQIKELLSHCGCERLTDAAQHAARRLILEVAACAAVKIWQPICGG